MKNLLKNFKNFKEKNDDCSFEIIINELDNVIKSFLCKVDSQEQDDLKQELLMGIIKIKNSFDFKKYENNDLLNYRIYGYVKQTFKNIYSDFINEIAEYKKTKIYLINISISEKKIDDNEESILLFLENNLDKEDMLFINLFITKNRIKTQKEVGNELGISQQAVNKRIKKISKKIKNLM